MKFYGSFAFNRKRNVLELEIKQDYTSPGTQKYVVGVSRGGCAIPPTRVGGLRGAGRVGAWAGAEGCQGDPASGPGAPCVWGRLLAVWPCVCLHMALGTLLSSSAVFVNAVSSV